MEIDPIVEELNQLKIGESTSFDNTDPQADDEENVEVTRREESFYADTGKYDWSCADSEAMSKKLKKYGYTSLASTPRTLGF